MQVVGFPPAYVVLDVLSTSLTLAIAAGFLWVARWSRQGLHAQLCAGFALVGTGFLFVALGHFQDGTEGDRLDAARILLQRPGALTILLADASHHGSERPHPLAVAMGAVGGALAFAAVIWFIPPTGRLPPLPEYFAAAYAVMTFTFLGCSILSGYGWHKRPTLGRALVPLGFLAWAMSTYSWIFIVLGGDDRLVFVVYVWRFAAILLLIWAMVRRPRIPILRLPDAPA